MTQSIRLQKVLASCGVASRRRSEELIVDGRVRVDGRVVTELGTRVDPRRQRIELDGRRVTHDVLVYIVLHKPRGVMSTLSDPEKRRTVADLVRDVGIRVAPVGRLDFNTSGVLLLTNDGDFASGLSHPSAGVPKEYLAKVHGRVDDAVLERLASSIEIDTSKTVPARVGVARREGDKTWLRFILHEGKNRQVRRLVEHAGLSLMRLSRIGYAGIGVDDMPMGRWRALSVDELKALKRDFGVPKRVRAGERAFHSGVPSAGGGRAHTARDRSAKAAPKRAAAPSRATAPGRDETSGPGRRPKPSAAPPLGRGKAAPPRGRGKSPPGKRPASPSRSGKPRSAKKKSRG
jgi:23S rRNA pseudouridine2605 synthase